MKLQEERRTNHYERTATTIKPVTRTANKRLAVLLWIYNLSINGNQSTAFQSFYANNDTSFRTRVSQIQGIDGIEISRAWVKRNGKRFKQYWIDQTSLPKAEKTLKSHGLI